MKYDTMYFLKKFDKIPEDQWCAELLTVEHSSGKIMHCALGHCEQRPGFISKEALTLTKIFKNRIGNDPEIVNDGIHKTIELGDSPKERIMNALLLINAGVEF